MIKSHHFQVEEYRILDWWSNWFDCDYHWTNFQFHSPVHLSKTRMSQNVSFIDDAFVWLGFWFVILWPVYLCYSRAEWILQGKHFPSFGTILRAYGSNLSVWFLLHNSCLDCWKVCTMYIPNLSSMLVSHCKLLYLVGCITYLLGYLMQILHL